MLHVEFSRWRKPLVQSPVELDRQLGRDRRPVDVGGWEVRPGVALGCPGVTYSHSTVVSVVFQVRLGRPFVRNGKVQSSSLRGSSGRLGGCVVLRHRVPFSPHSASASGVGVRHGLHLTASLPGRDPSRLCPGDWRGVVTLCPVLKHGPRSARGTRVGRVLSGSVLVACPTRETHVYWNGRSESNFCGCESRGETRGASLAEPYGHAVAGFECERICCDPKDGELCLRRVKPEETLVEARSGSDVQIDRRTWV